MIFKATLRIDKTFNFCKSFQALKKLLKKAEGYTKLPRSGLLEQSVAVDGL